MDNQPTRAAEAASAGDAVRPSTTGLARASAGGWRGLRRHGLAACLGGICALTPLQATTLNDLLNEPKLTPKKFANRFERFDFEPHDEVQAPDDFLLSQKGDCDDYAILADYVLRRRDLSTRLIHIRLVGRFAHAVCYVIEQKAYLDYNNRVFYANLEKCGPSLRQIAEEAASSFNANWTSASVFTYDYKENVKHMLVTVVKTEPASADPDLKTLPAPPPDKPKPSSTPLPP